MTDNIILCVRQKCNQHKKNGINKKDVLHDCILF